MNASYLYHSQQGFPFLPLQLEWVMEPLLLIMPLCEWNDPDQPLVVTGDAGHLLARSQARTTGQNETKEPEDDAIRPSKEQMVHVRATFLLTGQFSTQNPIRPTWFALSNHRPSGRRLACGNYYIPRAAPNRFSWSDE